MYEPVMKRASEGHCIARDNAVVALFSQCPFADIVAGAAYCLSRFLNTIPVERLKWSVVGSTSGDFKPLNAKVMAKCQSMLTAEAAAKKEIFFQLMGPEPYGPDYSFQVGGVPRPEIGGFMNETNVLEMRFPTSFLSEQGEDAFVEMVMDLFAHLRCDSGYAAIGLCADDDSMLRDAGLVIAPLAFRSHGFDIADAPLVSMALGARSRGARWLTLLSHKLVGKLGGQAELERKLPGEVTILGGPHGLLLRAGATPEIGDVNRNQHTPLLAAVAHAIEGVTYFGDNGLLSLFGQDTDRRDAWERRFWP